MDISKEELEEVIITSILKVERMIAMAKGKALEEEMKNRKSIFK